MRSLHRQRGWILHKMGGRRVVNLVISSNQASLYDAFVAAGSLPYPCDVAVTVNAGVVLQQGFAMGAWPAGTTMKLVNNGTIAGTGGVGGSGDGFTGPASSTGAQSGFAGGPAIVMAGSLVIDNTSGQINGGGGGGGGGGGAASTTVGSWNSSTTAGGGGGAGGRGYNNAAGGAGGVNTLGGNAGLPGGNGSSTAAGSAVGDHVRSVILSATSGDGGDGGSWATAGNTGQNGQVGVTQGIGQAGGAAGNAITKNGFTLTFPFAAGNNGTQVLGAIV